MMGSLPHGGSFNMLPWKPNPNARGIFAADPEPVCGKADAAYPCVLPKGHAGRHEDAHGSSWNDPHEKRRRCGCSGCLSGSECIDPYRAGGV